MYMIIFFFPLSQALISLGIQDVFSLASNLTSFNDNLFIKHVMQRLLITVNEEGTEAAAAGAAVIVTKITNSIRINRPFLFCVNSKDLVLFIGVFKRP